MKAEIDRIKIILDDDIEFYCTKCEARVLQKQLNDILGSVKVEPEPVGFELRTGTGIVDHFTTIWD